MGKRIPSFDVLTGLAILVKESQLRVWTKDEGVRGSAKAEHSQFITPVDPIPLLDVLVQDTRRNLCHPDGDEAHQANVCIVRSDENQGASGE